MLPFILKRIFNLIPVFFGATLLVFFIVAAAPGDFLADLRQDPNVSQETLQRLERRFGLDQPIPVQYFYWLRNIVVGDLGTSFTFDRPVIEVISPRIVNSMILVIGNILLLYAIAIPLGIFGAIRQYSLGDKTISIFSYLFLGFPSFFLGLIVVYLILQLQFLAGRPIFPVNGMTSVDHDGFNFIQKFLDIAWHAIMPILVITITGVASFSRFMRGQMLEFLNQDYIRTARAKGLAERTVIYKHTLRNAIVPFIASIGGILPGLIGGAGFVEYVFNWPGITPMLIEAINRVDVYLYTGFIALTLVLLIFGNLISDLLLAAVDPRIRYN
jgi:peptide/nickel transport system permease protein